ncbi:hypothetical protein DMENIID0001_006020 [Sergentomyia squamirostris]
MQLESGRKSNGVNEKNSGTMFPDLVTEKVETYYVPAHLKAELRSLKNPQGKIAVKKRNTIARYKSVLKKTRKDTDPELEVDQEERPSL